MASTGPTPPGHGAADQYVVHCPDVLAVRAEGRAVLTGRRVVEPDGCVSLGDWGRLRVEGRTVAAIAHQLAARTGLEPHQVGVRVAEFNSQQIYIFGQVTGAQRAVPYQGPETVLELLQRVGGVTLGAAPGDVHVVRARLAEGLQPEVFRVDLRAIVLHQDQQTNVRLEPFDQVYVGETRRSRLEKCVPTLLRPMYQTCCGMRP